MSIATAALSATLTLVAARGLRRVVLDRPGRCPTGVPGVDRARPRVRSRRREVAGRVVNAETAVAVIGAATVGLLVGPAPVIVLLLASVVGRRGHRLLADRTRRLETCRAAPDAVELLVLTIHAGLTPVQAVRELSASGPPAVRGGFAGVVERLERGDTFADALCELPRRLGSGMQAAADVLAGADRYGQPLAPALETMAYEARSSRRRRDEADARRLPVRLSFPLVFCTLPSFVLVAIAPAVIAAVSSLSFSF